MKTIIYTSFPCLIKSGNQQEYLTQNEHLIIEDNNSIINVYPNGKDEHSFLIDLEKPSPLYRVIKRDEKTLVFLTGGVLAENIICHNFEYEGLNSSIEVSTKNVTFCGKNGKKLINFSKKIENVKVGSFLFINYVKYIDNEQETIICYNPKKNNAKIFSADKIEINNDGFTLHKSGYNYKSIEEQYYVDSNGLKVKKKDFVTVENNNTPAETLPYKFMTAIKLGDNTNAINFLSNTLSQKLNEKVLKEYFGEISYFYMLDPLTCFAISNNKNIIYEFSLSNGKISDINDAN